MACFWTRNERADCVPIWLQRAGCLEIMRQGAFSDERILSQRNASLLYQMCMIMYIEVQPYSTRNYQPENMSAYERTSAIRLNLFLCGHSLHQFGGERCQGAKGACTGRVFPLEGKEVGHLHDCPECEMRSLLAKRSSDL